MDYDRSLMPIAIAAVKILLEIGVKPSIPVEQVCCGAPLKEVGSQEQLTTLVTKNVEAFKKAGCNQVITLCSGCGFSGKTLWPDVYKRTTGQELPFEVKDFTEFLEAFPLSRKKLHALNISMTYHDPCLLREGQGIYEEPRQLLRRIPGAVFSEMPGADYCCGGGGGLRSTNFEMSKRILNHKMSFVKTLDIDAIVTCCPICIKQLRIGLAQERLRQVRVLHLAVVMAETMGLV